MSYFSLLSYFMLHFIEMYFWCAASKNLISIHTAALVLIFDLNENKEDFIVHVIFVGLINVQRICVEDRLSDSNNKPIDVSMSMQCISIYPLYFRIIFHIYIAHGVFVVNERKLMKCKYCLR